ncbi:MAG: hypothetical protein AAB787_00435 [Patescibacteria group bacterium]
MDYAIFELYQGKTLQQDINKIAKPLEEGRIDSTEIIVDDDGNKTSESISADEKKYFDIEQVIVAKTEKAQLTGYFLSLFKSTNKGYFILNDGTRVTYQIVAEHPESLWPSIIHKGVVRIECTVHIDENLKPSLLEVYKVEIIQQKLF